MEKNNDKKSINKLSTRELNALPTSDIATLQLNNLADGTNIAPLKTSLPGYDAALAGGLYPGIHVIAADTGTGKTSLCLQMANNIAKQGRRVMYVSTEMSHQVLIAKSLSNLSLCLAIRHNDDKYAFAYQSFAPGLDSYQAIAAKKQYYKECWKEYDTYCDRISFFVIPETDDASGDYTLGVLAEIRQTIKETVEEHPEEKPPVVIVDYLQMLALLISKTSYSERQAIDSCILTLKHISSYLDTPVIVISSVNRSKSSNTIKMADTKGSNGIEYTADTVAVLDDRKVYAKTPPDDNNEKKQYRLQLEKNRHAEAGSYADLDFYGAWSFFKDVTKDVTQETESE